MCTYIGYVIVRERTYFTIQYPVRKKPESPQSAFPVNKAGVFRPMRRFKYGFRNKSKKVSALNFPQQNYEGFIEVTLKSLTERKQCNIDKYFKIVNIPLHFFLLIGY